MAELTAELEKALGGWQGSKDAAAIEVGFPPLPPTGPTRLILVDKPGAPQSVISVALPGDLAPLARLLSPAGDERRFRRAIFQPLELEPPREEGLYVRGAVDVRVARAPARAVCRHRQRADGGDRPRAGRVPQGVWRHGGRASDHGGRGGVLPEVHQPRLSGIVRDAHASCRATGNALHLSPAGRLFQYRGSPGERGHAPTTCWRWRRSISRSAN